MTTRTVILCGGKGTRAYPQTATLPKPLLEVDGQPILAHVMEVYARQGFADFVLAAGYMRDLIEEFAATCPSSWVVDVVDTGEETNTGGRVRRVAELVGEEFFVTYADGLGDVDLGALLERHREHPGAATMTAVPLPSQYGTIEFDESGRVQRFREKPRLHDHFINAGFLAFDRRVFDIWEGEDLERETLPALAHDGELYTNIHTGFWKSMDTHKDALELTALCSDGVPPWLA